VVPQHFPRQADESHHDCTNLTRTAGLRAINAEVPIPLERVDVRAEVTDTAATVTLRQVYRNVEKVPLEVVYVFPLDEGRCRLRLRGQRRRHDIRRRGEGA